VYYDWSSADPVHQKWWEVLAAVFESIGHDGRGTHRIWAGRHAVVAGSSCTPIRLFRTPRALRGRLLDQFGFRLVLSGTAEIETSRGSAIAGAGDFQVIDLQKPARLGCGVGSETFSEITLWLPRTRLQALIGDEHQLHGSVLKAEHPAVRVLASALKSAVAEGDALSANLIDDLSTGFAALAAAASRQSSMLAAAPQDSLVVICRYIESNLGARDLGVVTLVRTFGLSRASLYRLFEPVGGVANYIRSRRLERAHQEICTAGLDSRRIAPIAYRSGFKSIAAFNRAYQEAYARTPRQSRAQRMFGPKSEKHLAQSEQMGVLAHCLLEMSG
jgi:AraC-like DNA-binding protein